MSPEYEAKTNATIHQSSKFVKSKHWLIPLRFGWFTATAHDVRELSVYFFPLDDIAEMLRAMDKRTDLRLLKDFIRLEHSTWHHLSMMQTTEKDNILDIAFSVTSTVQRTYVGWIFHYSEKQYKITLMSDFCTYARTYEIMNQCSLISSSK